VVRRGSLREGYVSYHLMPLYTDGALKADIPPELAQRMQGRAR
jgi:hypothetical protein